MYEDLIKALKTIQTVCAEENNFCEGCPMGNEVGECNVLEEIPVYWNIIKPKEVIRVME